MQDSRIAQIEQDLALDRVIEVVEGWSPETMRERRQDAEDALFRALSDTQVSQASTSSDSPRSRNGLWLVLVMGVALVGGMLAFASLASAAEKIEGRATVSDGDTLAIEGSKARIRLYGIDAPEKGQTCDDASGKRYLCGTRAAQYLADLIGRSGRVVCFEEDRDRYGRIVAECATSQNVVLNAEMVKAGWAIEYRQYSDGRYDQEEAEAKRAKRGLWSGQFIEPSKWRNDGDRLESERVASGQPKGCDIKGNISGSGRIYHMPGQQNYSRTKIDEKAGERWFCSAGEAEAAGWRAARQ